MKKFQEPTLEEKFALAVLVGLGNIPYPNETLIETLERVHRRLDSQTEEFEEAILEYAIRFLLEREDEHEVVDLLTNASEEGSNLILKEMVCRLEEAYRGYPEEFEYPKSFNLFERADIFRFAKMYGYEKYLKPNRTETKAGRDTRLFYEFGIAIKEESVKKTILDLVNNRIATFELQDGSLWSIEIAWIVKF